MRIAFIMDPIEYVLIDKDTTFALMLEAQARGHQPLYVRPQDLFARDGTVFADVRPVTLKAVPRPDHATLHPVERVDLASIDAIFIRTDPPFDATYLYVTQLLDIVRNRVLVLNDPRGLRDANEKLYALHFPEVMPRTIVTPSEDRIREFLSDIGTHGIIKPLDGAGGRGIMVLDPADKNFRSIIETLSDAGRRYVMVQEFLPAVRFGDKRVLLLEGEALGAILRVPRADEARSNIHVGGSVQPSELDADDLKIIAAVAPKLRADGLYFVGLDVIGGKLTEVNVTSPTGIQELSRFTGSAPETKVIAWIERRASDLKTAAR